MGLDFQDPASECPLTLVAAPLPRLVNLDRYLIFLDKSLNLFGSFKYFGQSPSKYSEQPQICSSSCNMYLFHHLVITSMSSFSSTIYSSKNLPQFLFLGAEPYSKLEYGSSTKKQSHDDICRVTATTTTTALVRSSVDSTTAHSSIISQFPVMTAA